MCSTKINTQFVGAWSFVWLVFGWAPSPRSCKQSRKLQFDWRNLFDSGKTMMTVPEVREGGEGCSRNCNQPGKMCLILRPESNTAHEQSERISERECITTASRTGQYIFLCFILFRWLLSWLVWKSLYYLHTTTHGAKSLKWISWWWCVCVCDGAPDWIHQNP